MKTLNNFFFLSLLLLSGCVQLDIKKEPLSAGNSLELTKSELNTSFILAVKQHRLEDMQDLLNAGANVKTPIPYIQTDGDCDWQVETTALIYAVRHNDPDMIKVLVKVEKELNKALEIAIKEGYSAVVTELLQGGADINYVNEYQATPLMIAINYARPEAEFSPQAQAQYHSRWQQRQQIIQNLLQAGSNVNHVDKDGKTALMYAVQNHDLNTVQYILQTPEINRNSFFSFTATPLNYADTDGNTALILAIKNVQYFYIDNQQYNICINSQKIIHILLETPGIDAYHVNNNGDTAITLLEDASRKANSPSYQ